MAIKSLTITEDAYETLKRMKYSDESFSDVILRVGKTQANVVEKYFGILKGTEEDAEDWKKRIREERTKADIAFSKKQRKIWGSLQTTGKIPVEYPALRQPLFS